MLPSVNEARRTPSLHERADSRREMRRLRRLLGHCRRTLRWVGPPICWCAAGGTVVITEVPEFCGAEHILAQRAKDRGDGRGGLRDGGLVQGVRVEVRHGAQRESRVPATSPAVSSTSRSSRSAPLPRRARRASKASSATREVPSGKGPVADAGSWLRPGIDAGSGRCRLAGRGVHDRPGHDDRQRHRAGREARVQHAGLSADVARSGSVGRRHHRRHRDDRSGRRSACSSTSAASPRARCSQRRKRPSTASSECGPSSRCRSDACGRAGRRRPSRDPGRAARAARTWRGAASRRRRRPLRHRLPHLCRARQLPHATSAAARSRFRQSPQILGHEFVGIVEEARQRRSRSGARRPGGRRSGPQLRERRTDTGLRVLRDRRLASMRVLLRARHHRTAWCARRVHHRYRR